MWNLPALVGLDSYVFLLFAGFVVAAFVKWLLVDTRFVVTTKVDDIYSNFILISGCDSGFGRALTIRLLNDGLNVVAGCFTQEVIYLSHSAFQSLF